MAQENKYKGYPLIFEAEADGAAKTLRDRGNEITCVTFEGLGTSIEVEGIQKGKNPKVMGRFHDPKQEVEGDFWIMVPDGGIKHIIVPASKIKIG